MKKQEKTNFNSRALEEIFGVTTLAPSNTQSPTPTQKPTNSPLPNQIPPENNNATLIGSIVTGSLALLAIVFAYRRIRNRRQENRNRERITVRIELPNNLDEIANITPLPEITSAQSEIITPINERSQNERSQNKRSQNKRSQKKGTSKRRENASIKV